MGTPGSSRPQGLPSKLLYDEYQFQSSLGEGQYGSVWRCVERSTGRVLACKQMNKKKHPKSVDRETTCFVRVQSHRNIVQLEQVFEDAENIYFLMDLCTGGDLLPVICKSGGLPEEEASAIFWQLVEAVGHCHARGVIHRDIKPENVLLDTPVDGVPLVKLADFGLATAVKKGKMAQGWVGSPPYEAPEVIELKPYDFQADVWSLGVVLYGMLSANWPSFLQGRKFNRRIDFQAPIWEPISGEAKSLITRMLASNPMDRPTTDEILQDSWFAMFLPDSMRPYAEELELEDPMVHPAQGQPPLSIAKMLPIDLLPPLGRQQPQVAPYKRGAAGAVGEGQGLGAEGEEEGEHKMQKTDGSFGTWLEDSSDDTSSGGQQGPASDFLPLFDLGGMDCWKAASASTSESPSRVPAAPPPAPCDGSSASAPSSPDSKPMQVCSPGPLDRREERSITKQIGKRLLQLVSGTLGANPMCTRMIPSVSTGDGSGALFDLNREPELQRPRTSCGLRY